jgi:quinol monooxygenase YgiN
LNTIPQGLVVRIAELDIDPDFVSDYRTLLAEQIEAAVRLEPGALFLFAVNVKGEPAKVRVMEGYASQQAYAEHLAAPHFLTYKTKTASMVLSLRLIETETIALATTPGAVSGKPREKLTISEA